MWDFRLGEAFGLMMRTMPFILVRLGIYFGITLAYILVTGIGAGLGWGIGIFGGADFRESTTLWGGIIGFGLTAGVLYFLREYLLYMVKAAHIAVLVDLIEGKDMPEGQNQITHGQKMVRERFAEASVLFALDQLIKGVLRAVVGMVEGIAGFLPLPGVDQFVGLIRGFLKIAVGFIDEVILAYNVRTRATNPWASAQEALILYGQNYKILLKNAAWLAVIIYGLSFLAFIVLLAPAGAIAFLFPSSLSAFGVVIALLLAWSLKAALLEPLAITCLMQVYFPAIGGQTPNPEWDRRLSEVSSKFRDIKDKAVSWMAGKSASDPA